uniref:Uncharacterized protein n=1 Tax=Arundo donax TaxID=35708 RepID=A0A0A9EU14_ARUDO
MPLRWICREITIRYLSFLNEIEWITTTFQDMNSQILLS